MIARFRILLPHVVLVAPDNPPTPYETEREGLRLRVFPPYRAELDLSALDTESTVPVGQLPGALDPAEPQPLSPTHLMDDLRVIAANVLQIDVLAEKFERSQGTEDPPVAPVFAEANSILRRLRHLTRATHIKPIDQRSTIWRMDFLNDDESELASAEGLYRRRGGARWELQYLGLPPSLWDAAAAFLPDFQLDPSASLLLDAYSLLPDIGPALVLATSAIETRTDSALDLLAEGADLDHDFWEWLRQRGGQYHKEPSFAEKLDPLLKGVAGVSLRDEALLWQKFQDIRKARNTFTHEGLPSIGNTIVDSDKAIALIRTAEEIIDWIEALLPEAARRPPFEPWVTIQSERTLFGPFEDEPGTLS